VTTWQRLYGADLHPEGKQVETRFPLTEEQAAAGDRPSWPWLPGWIAEVCGPNEWQVVLQAPGLGRTAEGEIPDPGVPDSELFFPACFRDASEIREPQPEAEAGP
jgi:hypothetical protein